MVTNYAGKTVLERCKPWVRTPRLDQAGTSGRVARPVLISPGNTVKKDWIYKYLRKIGCANKEI